MPKSGEDAAREWMRQNVSPHEGTQQGKSTIPRPQLGPVDLSNPVYGHKAALERAVEMEKAMFDLWQGAVKQGETASILKKYLDSYAEAQRRREAAFKTFNEISVIEGDLIKKADVVSRDKVVYKRLNNDLEKLGGVICEKFLTDRPDELLRIINEAAQDIKKGIIGDLENEGAA